MLVWHLPFSISFRILPQGILRLPIQYAYLETLSVCNPQQVFPSYYLPYFSKLKDYDVTKCRSASEVQNSGSATTGNASQSEPNADDGSISNGTASNISLGKGSSDGSMIIVPEPRRASRMLLCKLPIF